MVPSEAMGSLAAYLETQRKVRELSEELEEMKSSRTVEAALRIKHELDALLADYELTPEQLLEALCVLFDLARPVGFQGSSLLKDEEAEDGNGELQRDRREDRSVHKGQQLASEQGGDKRQGKTPTVSTRKSRKQRVNDAMLPARRVTILSPEEREAAAGALNKKPGGGSNGHSGKLPADKAPANTSTQISTRPRKRMKIYTNPHSGEVVKTRGANHRTLNQWRQKYGYEAVDSWWKYEELGAE